MRLVSLDSIGIGTTGLGGPYFGFEADTGTSVGDLGLPGNCSALFAFGLHELVGADQCPVDGVGPNYRLAC